MTSFLRIFVVLLTMLPSLAQGATIKETWLFRAHFNSQKINPYLFFLPQTSTTAGFLIAQQGMQVGQTYEGLLSIEHGPDGDVVSRVSCTIGLFDCAVAGNYPHNFFMLPGLRGPRSIFQLGNLSSPSSMFSFQPGHGVYTYADDFGRDASISNFSLTDVNYRISEVPLPTSLPLLVFTLGGLMLLRQRKVLAA